MSYEKNKIIKANQTEGINCEDAIYSNDYFDVVLPFSNNIDELLLKYNTQCYQIIDENFVILHPKRDISGSELLQISVEVVPRVYGPYGTISMNRSGITSVHEQPFLNLKGKDILIGFVDSGIDYTHPVFINNNETKIIAIWDQTIKGGTKPFGFKYGTEFTIEQINEALNSQEPLSVVPSIDETGHGTFIAGIAAGNKVDNYNYVGAAPEAEILMVKLKPAKEYLRKIYLIRDEAILYQDTDIILGIKYLLQKANELKKPISICIGLGSNQGGHDGTGFLERYVIEASLRKGIAVSVAAGNEANLGHHYLGNYSKDVNLQDVEIFIDKDERGIDIQIWANTPDVYSVAILSPTGEFIPRFPIGIFTKEIFQLLIEKSTVSIENRLYQFKTGDQIILVRIIEPTEGIWTLRVFGEIVVVGRYNIWLAREDWIKPKTRFLQPNPFTTVTIPGTSIAPITVGAYNHLLNSMSDFSGRGLTRDLEMKPDLVAPGVDVEGPIAYDGYGLGSGTSIATAHVAGAAALILEWGILQGNYPEVDTTIIKKALIRGADRKEQLIYPNRLWGYGSLNLFNTFQVFRNIKPI